MTIHLPRELEGPIRSEILRGRFASEDDMIAEIVRDYFRRNPQASWPAPEESGREQPAPASADKPVWERILERTADIPEEEWEKLPTDLAVQHDHYLYGTPKRPDP